MVFYTTNSDIDTSHRPLWLHLNSVAGPLRTSAGATDAGCPSKMLRPRLAQRVLADRLIA
jgi:hypothetical protein